jgi:hypothetical protein
MKRRFDVIATIRGNGRGFVPGHWRPDAPTGTPIYEEPGREPPPPPVNSSTGGQPEPCYEAAHIRAREATAANLATLKAALAPRRWTPPEKRSPEEVIEK